MGSSSSSAKQLTEIINKKTTDILVKVSTKGSSTYYGEQTVNITGNSGNIYGITTEQLGSIDITAIQDSTINADLQQQLINGITSSIEQKKSDFPSLSINSSSSNIENIVRNEVATNFSISAIATLDFDIRTAQTVNIKDNTGNIGAIFTSSKVSAIGKVVNTMSSSIIDKLSSEVKVDSKSSQAETFFGADLINSLGDSLKNLINSPGGIIVIIIGVLVFVFYMQGGMGAAGPTIINQQPQQLRQSQQIRRHP